MFSYIVKELCEEVNVALSYCNNINAWVKYKIVSTTGPGYYAAVSITKKGKWSSSVHRLSSTMSIHMGLYYKA